MRDLPPLNALFKPLMRDTELEDSDGTASKRVKVCFSKVISFLVSLSTLFELDPKESFVEKHDEILDEFLKLYASNIDETVCARCKCDAAQLYTCHDCFQDSPKCQACVLENHAHLPTHRLKVSA